MLEVRTMSAAYGQHPALDQVSLTVAPGEIVVILGANGAGKSTLLRAIAGICAGRVSGSVTLDGQPLTGLSSDRIVEQGVALVPEGRGIFGDLTVKENLLLGAYSKRARSGEEENLQRVLGLFPKLIERQGQIARTMSGGEQQMVAIGRAMMSAPQILMLDEPSLGLSPLLCKELFQNLKAVKKLGIGVLLVEQNAKQSLAIADRGYLLENTRIVHEDSAARLATDPAVQKAYLGAGGGAAKPAAPKTAPVSAPVPAEKPETVVRVARPVPRRTADQQTGLDIEALVAEAARVSAEPRAGGAAATPPRNTDPARAPVALGAAHQSRLDTVIRDIERAAREARNRPAPAPEPRPTSPQPERAAPPTDNNPPPVVEVYRRPRVEVYRRRPSGDFERN